MNRPTLGLKKRNNVSKVMTIFLGTEVIQIEGLSDGTEVIKIVTIQSDGFNDG